MDDVAIRNLLMKLVGYGERAKDEFLVSNVNIEGRNICKYGKYSGA